MLMLPVWAGFGAPGAVLGNWTTGGALVMGLVLFRGVGRRVRCARRCLHPAYAVTPTSVYHAVSQAQVSSCEMTLQA